MEQYINSLVRHFPVEEQLQFFVKEVLVAFVAVVFFKLTYKLEKNSAAEIEFRPCSVALRYACEILHEWVYEVV